MFLAKVVLLSPTYIGQRGGNSIFQNRTCYFGGASIVSFILNDGPIKFVCYQNKTKIELGRLPKMELWRLLIHLITLF